ncbi:hypothetical protein Tco_1226942 [Tanacetum coccineum]
MKEKSTKPAPSKKSSKEDDEYNLQRGIQMSLESFQEPIGGVDICEPTLGVTRSLPVVEGKGKGIATDEQGDTEILNVGKKGEDVSNTVALEERIVKHDEGQAGSDPGNTLESRPSLDEDQAGSTPRPSHVALAGPNPEPMHEDFIATIYPKNLDDAFTYGDQFMFDKPTEEEPGKANVETVVESMDQTAQAISSRIFTLENHDLYLKIDKYINENVKEAVQNALKALVCKRFKELSEFEMKEILHDRMFESGFYRSQPKHTTLYDALKASMDCENREEFMDAKPKTATQSEQPVDDVPIPNNVHISNSKDTSTAHLLKIKTKPDWLKPIPKEDRLETPELDWVIPLNDLPEPSHDMIRNIVIRIRVEDLQLSIESYQTKLNLTKPSWDASDFIFKEDYTIVSKPRVIIYRDRNDQKKMMRETEVHKFNDGTLTRILEKLDHMVKDFMLFKFNRRMEHRIWFEDDQRRSKEFIEVIERRIKIRRIFRSLERFVSVRLRDVDYRLIQRTE